MTKIVDTCKGLIVLAVIACMTLLLLPGQSYAERYKVMGDKDLFITGFIRQKAIVGFHNGDFSRTGEAGLSALPGYQLDGAYDGLNSFLTTFYIENQLLWNDSLEFRLSLRYEMDTVDKWHSSSDTWAEGVGMAWDRYSSSYDIEGDDSINDMIRECTVAFFSQYVSVRAGKQQLGWGEADGIRLMDQINPLDMRKEVGLRDAEEGFHETRIPLWMVKFDFTPDFNFGSSLGFQNLDLECTWIPDVKRANMIALGPREGGPWGQPLPDLPVPLRQLNVPDDFPERRDENFSYAVRLKGIFLDTFFTLNGYYGWNNNFVLTERDDQNPLLTNATIWMGEGNASDGFGLELTLNKTVFRQKFVGFTVSRELPIMPLVRMLCQYTLPVIRVEALYDKDVRFAVGTDKRDAAVYTDWLWNNTIKKRDIVRYLVGLDWNTHFSFINPSDDVFVSLQFTQNRINGSVRVNERTDRMIVLGAIIEGTPYFGGDRQRLSYAPYFWFPKAVETTTSLQLQTAYFNDKLTPVILAVRDWTYNSFVIKYKVGYKLRDSWRFDVGYYTFHGSGEQNLGIFENYDSIYAAVKYQF